MPEAFRLFVLVVSIALLRVISLISHYQFIKKITSLFAENVRSECALLAP